MFCAIGCTVGTLVGLLPGLGPLATISLLLPLTYSIPTTRRAHHAGGHLLRRAVRRQRERHHDEDPARQQHRRLHRRLPDDAQGQDRPGAVHRGRLQLHRRHGGDRRARVSGADAGRGGLPVRARRLLRPDAGGLRVRELRHHRQPAQRPGDVPDRRAARADRHRRQQRHAALHHESALPRSTASAS